MPTTEVPTSSPERPPEPPLFRRRSRYENLETHELFSLIEEYEDERAKARMRESIWISIIIYMCIAWFLFYGPRYIFHQPHVINPSDALKNRKDLTYLDLPPDALKNIKPKPNNIISDKDRVAQSKTPQLDKKTLEQLQAMKKAGPQLPTPEQQQPAPQQAQQAPPPEKQTQPLPSNSQSQLEAPTPAPSKPNFNTGPLNPGDAIRQAAKNAGRGPISGDDGLSAPNQHQGLKAGADIISDTMGVDFGPYMQHVIRETRNTWEPLIPEVARPPLMKKGTVYIQFIILPDGSVRKGSMQLIGGSGDVSLDRAAWGAITGSNYPKLPGEFKGPYLELRFAFIYNQPLGQDR